MDYVKAQLGRERAGRLGREWPGRVRYAQKGGAGSNESALELGAAMAKWATVTGSQRNCDPVSSQEDVTESGGS